MVVYSTRCVHNIISFVNKYFLPGVLIYYFRWDAIWKAAEARGDKEVCFTTEFGPPNYQVCDPKSGLPLAKVWVSTTKYDSAILKLIYRKKIIYSILGREPLDCFETSSKICSTLRKRKYE